MSILSLIGCAVGAFILLMFGRGVYYGYLAKKYAPAIDTQAALLLQQMLMGLMSEEDVAKNMDLYLSDLFNDKHQGYRDAVVKEVQRRIPIAKVTAAIFQDAISQMQREQDGNHTIQ